MSPANDPARDVLGLTLIRLMPQDDFIRLCAEVLEGEMNTLHGGGCLGVTGNNLQQLVGRGRWRTLADGSEPTDKDAPCERCGGAVEDRLLTVRCRAATGVWACKACIDEALGAVHDADHPAGPLRAVLLSPTHG